MHLQEETLVVDPADEAGESKKIPLEQIDSILFYTKPCISFQAVIKLSEKQIPQYYCHPNGKLYFSVPVAGYNYQIWIDQYKLSQDNDFCLGFSRKIVAAKIHNSRAAILRAELENEQIQKLKILKDECASAQSFDSLRGIEGSASVIYFKLLRGLIPEEWKFLKRIKNPPTDPVNVLLSLGYSVLYNHLSSALQTAGLNPEIGFFHSKSFRHNALASDIIEEFRFLAESAVLYVIHKGIVTLADFENGNTDYPCRLNNTGLRSFLLVLEQRIQNKIKLSETELHCYRELFFLKARSISKLISGSNNNYNAFEVK